MLTCGYGCGPGQCATLELLDSVVGLCHTEGNDGEATARRCYGMLEGRLHP